MKTMMDFITTLALTNKALTFDPDFFDGFGSKNLQSYKRAFMRIFGGLDNNVINGVILISLYVKNLQRFTSAAENCPEVFEESAELAAIKKAIADKCCQTTKEFDANSNMFPMVKIPETMCSMSCFLYVYYSEKEVDANDLVSKTYFTSMDIGPELQMMNKAAVKDMWNSWKGCEFNEEIYTQMSRDKEPFIMPTGEIRVNKIVNMEDLQSYINSVRKARATNIPKK